MLGHYGLRLRIGNAFTRPGGDERRSPASRAGKGSFCTPGAAPACCACAADGADGGPPEVSGASFGAAKTWSGKNSSSSSSTTSKAASRTSTRSSTSTGSSTSPSTGSSSSSSGSSTTDKGASIASTGSRCRNSTRKSSGTASGSGSSADLLEHKTRPQSFPSDSMFRGVCECLPCRGEGPEAQRQQSFQEGARAADAKAGGGESSLTGSDRVVIM